MMVSGPENSPSCESMPMLLKVMPVSLEMMEVMLVTMPIDVYKRQVLLLIIGCVVFKAWRIANENPVDSIKSE